MTDEKKKSKRLNEKTIRSLSFFRAILESTACGILVLDSQGEVVDFNNKFIELWSVPSKLREQKNHAGLIQHLLEQLEDPDTFAEKIKIDISELEDEITIEVHQANGRMIECHFSPHRLDGAIIGKVLNFRDVTAHKKADEVLHEHEKRHRDILEGIEEGYYETDLAGNYTFVNEAVCRHQGRTRAEMIGLNNRNHTSPEAAKIIFKIFHEVYSTGVPARVVDYETLRKDGSVIFLEVSVSLLRNARGVPVGFHGITRDVTEKKWAEQALIASEERYRTILDNIEDGYYEVDLTGNLVFFNDSLCRIYGYSRDELMEMNNRDYMSPSTSKNAFMIFNSVYVTGKPSKVFDWEFIKKDGSKTFVEISVSLIKDAFGRRIGFRGIVRDITARKLSEERLEFLANYDSLTRLLNRTLFRDRLGHAMDRAHRQNSHVAVVFIDLDRFKSVNDTMGHSFGDRLLQLVAERTKSCLRDSDTIARLGGDEFTVMLEDIASPEKAAVVAKKILMKLSQLFIIDGHDIYTSASIGITIYPMDATDVDNLLKNADTAMYLAKDRGRNNYQFFTPQMNAKAQERLMLENSLRRAEEKDEFILYYQPLIDLNTGGLAGFEALIRWQHPDLGILSPDKFIPIAEETGRIITIGEWVLHTACTQWRRWCDAGYAPVLISVNISIIQFQQRDLADVVTSIVEHTGMDPRYLELELTESALISNPDSSKELLKQLKATGIRFAIDDFGTGYSSLNYLKQFPIDTLKIDRSFIRDIVTDPNDTAIVQVIISLARILGLDVVAEGIENQEQCDFLKNENCHKAQGFLFSRPIPPEKAIEWLTKNVA